MWDNLIEVNASNLTHWHRKEGDVAADTVVQLLESLSKMVAGSSTASSDLVINRLVALVNAHRSQVKRILWDDSLVEDALIVAAYRLYERRTNYNRRGATEESARAYIKSVVLGRCI